MSKQQDSSPSPLRVGTQIRSWPGSLRKAIGREPDRLMALRATLAMAVLAIPLLWAGLPFFAVTLALGVLAGALSETDDHPKGRIKSLGLKVISFGLSSLSVGLLRPWPVILAAGLAFSTVFLLLVGGLSERYRGVTFGSILTGIYTMIGSQISPDWYWQPILLSAGALFYGLLSLGILYAHPWRPVEEHLAKGFLALSRYMEEKSRVFPSDESIQQEVRNKLALLNIGLVNELERCKEVLNSYSGIPGNEHDLRKYLQYFMLLQSLHERAASTHERYDLLSGDPKNRELMEGIGQLLRELARAGGKLSQSLLTGAPYRHPAAPGWAVSALKTQLEKSGLAANHPLSMLIHNLSRSNLSLKNVEEGFQLVAPPRLARDSRTAGRRFRDQLKWDHPRLRHAIRLSLCFVAGFAISEGFHIAKGEWIILTSLFVCQPSYSETRRRLFQRILGTFTGVTGGVIVVSLLPTIQGQVVLLLTSACLFFLWLHRQYAVSVIFITVFVLCAFNLIAGQGIAVMLPRLIDTLIGSALAILSVRFLWPEWQQKKLPSLLSSAFLKNTRYFRAVLEAYRRPGQDDDLDYRIARREAHQADNALALAWQNMQVEPARQKQFSDLAFTLTYLNHALLSYLSALGAHRSEQRPDAEIMNVADGLAKVMERTDPLSLPGEENEHDQLLSMIGRIRQMIVDPATKKDSQALVLLYNIAEVTYQLLLQGNAFGQITPVPIKSEKLLSYD